MNHIEELFNLIKVSLKENSFVKLSLGNYKGSIEALKNCHVKKTHIKQEDKFSFTYRYQTKDIVKNYSLEEGIDKLYEFVSNGEFRHLTLFTRLAMEDSAPGLAAARAAGVPAVITRSIYFAKSDFTGALAVMSDLDHGDDQTPGPVTLTALTARHATWTGSSAI